MKHLHTSVSARAITRPARVGLAGLAIGSALAIAAGPAAGDTPVLSGPLSSFDAQVGYIEANAAYAAYENLQSEIREIRDRAMRRGPAPTAAPARMRYTDEPSNGRALWYQP